MKVIIKTETGYYKLLNNGRFVSNESKENATILTTQMGVHLVEEKLKKHHVPFEKEEI